MNPQKTPIQERWERAHEQPRFRPAYPHEQVVRWAFRNLDRNAASTTKVLDLGCGAGRHSLFFASEGFDTYACDISEVGLRELHALAQRRSVAVQTHQTPAHDLSHYPDNFFDAVLCYAVIYYMTLAEAEQMLSEVLRILRPTATFFCVTRTDKDGRLQKATPIGPSAWHINALTPGAPSDMEEDMDMLFFSKAKIQNMFSAFNKLCIDRMTYIHEEFVDDDWVVTASKP